MDYHNIKATLTSHGFNAWSEAQKVCYLIIGIKTNIVDTCLANISGSVALRDDFAAVVSHVDDFLVIMKYCDPGINRNISGVETK